MMTNEQKFFDFLKNMEPTERSLPLEHNEIMQIYFDVSIKTYKHPLLEFVRRIEQAHGIGIKNGRSKTG